MSTAHGRPPSDGARHALWHQLRACFDEDEPPQFRPGETRIPLIAPSYGPDEVWEALDSMLSGRVTMGEKVERFEAAFARYLGVRHAVMVNSGSSANLLAVAALTSPRSERPLQPGAEVITPAVTWATTVWPIAQAGLVPVLVDVEAETYNIDPKDVEAKITSRTRAIMAVHLFGNPCDMTTLREIADRHNIFLIEDCCQAHFAEHQGQIVGSIGDIAGFSFGGKHISAGGGGIVLTNNESLGAQATLFMDAALPRDDGPYAGRPYANYDSLVKTRFEEVLAI